MAMNRIRVLDPQTTDQIAAGEIIENPASVVKELVENSLDAEASFIKIEIINGGISRIKVSDNGIGISPQEVKIAFKRHATSKISSFYDLNNIRTLGFRGEALASIAAVSKIEIFTRTRENISGIFLKIEGGEIIKEEERGGPPGTTITVKDLFYNVPARKKHLRTPTAESASVGNIINKLTLSHPGVKITYENNNSIISVSPGDNKLLSTIEAIFGFKIKNKMVKLKLSDDKYKISGYAALPEMTRGNRSGQFFIVNGRVVQSRVLSDGLEAAYHTLLSNKRFPIAVIRIEVDPKLIDVNVHPAKKEIRWLEPFKIKNLITKGVREAIIKKEIIPGLSNEIKNDSTSNTTTTAYEQKSLNWKRVVPLIAELPQDKGFSDYNNRSQPNVVIEEDDNSQITTENENKQQFFPHLIPLTQIDATYILAKSDEQKGFFIIDQHAAHERIIYDTLYEKLKNKNIVSQYLAPPIAIDLSPSERSNIIQNIIILKELGFLIEHFGENTYLIRSVPHGLSKLKPEEFIHDLLSQDIENNSYQIKHAILQMISCKAAIKAGEKLQFEEMKRLLNDLKETNTPFTCPHGRPTTVYLSSQELNKRFHR